MGLSQMERALDPLLTRALPYMADGYSGADISSNTTIPSPTLAHRWFEAPKTIYVAWNANRSTDISPPSDH